MVESYLAQAIENGQATAEPLRIFEYALGKLMDLTEPFATKNRDPDPLAETWEDLTSSQAKLSNDIKALVDEVAVRATSWNEGGHGGARDNATLHAAREGLHDMAEHCRGLTKQIDMAAKLASRAVTTAVKELEALESVLWANAEISRSRRTLEDGRREAVEALQRARSSVRQADWLQERFPRAELQDVEGLVKLIDRSEIEAHDWSLTPGRYVGIVPEEEDEGFDFEEVLREIHSELEDLNAEATMLAATITKNFAGLEK